ncbi:protein STRUBBELIG-RECEPTOR FAMILY 6 [Elaeis guineensis]|uniref:Protein STRUBBELIG-RECEPTOR FAMILY 7 n=1 Tax=Elaeis guineensis var. tenera TaxID=51953 RepID=A0A6I9SCP3_ELAGV|nr:protein STRUBBELIG-RECEPTOR FAMILY 7 [Elaeis guineensis]
MSEERDREKGMLGIRLLLVCIWIWNPSFVHGATNSADVSALNVLYSSLNSPGQLTGWTSNGGDPCGQSWLGVTCSGQAVTTIKLSGLGLSGSLGYQMASMASLTELDISNNNLGGGQQIPYNLPPNLERLNLAGNQFNGNVPYSISLMFPLKYLNLGHNQLQGNLSDIFGKLTNLTTMDLSSNSLTGDLPQSFSSLSSLTTLYLQNNQFTGSIDVLASLPLNDLNVANNHFTGWIPDKLRGINNLQTGGNSWSSGPAPPPPPFTPPPPSRRSNPGQHSGSSSSPSGGGGKSSGIGAGGIAGIIISIFVIGGIIAFFLIRKKTQRSSREELLEQDQPFTPLAPKEVKEMKSIQTSSTISTATLPSAAPISLKPPPIDRHKSFDEDDFSNKPVVKKANTAPIKATVYSVADLQMATDSFSVENLIGEGSFGRVYRAQFSDGKVLAVKKINSSALPNQSADDFIELVSNISRLHHPNLTELVGYCSEHGQYLLVYEFHKNGSLHDLLHLSDEYSKPLSWSTRVKIALGSARALEYLHEVCSPSVVHKNFKSSNILLDMELNPHLSDCGLANLTPDAEFQASDQNMGSGYSAPEVAMSGQYTLKSDVYGFGVVMLELLTGRKPFESSRSRSEQSLVRWATPQLHDIDALDRMVDPALKGLYPAKSLSRFADVIALCVQPEPEFRPPMSEVVQALVRLVQRANMSKRVLSGDTQETARRSDDPDTQDYL